MLDISGGNVPVRDIEKIFADADFASSIRRLIAYVPELKHELAIANELSWRINAAGGAARREVRRSDLNRRFDLEIAGTYVEAKYHLECDLPEIAAILQPSSYSALRQALRHRKPSTWSAGEAFACEVLRAGESIFLWSLCIRSDRSPKNVCMAKRAEKYRESTGTQSLQSALVAGQNLIQSRIVGAVQLHRPDSTCVPLMPIQCEHSVLLSYVFKFGSRRDA